MRRVWASLLAVWSTLAIVAVLAWSHPPTSAPLPLAPATVVVHGKNGKSHVARVFVVAGTQTPHATTHTSAPPP